ncbi:energy transducer TonB [Cetobacterium ceti]
MMKMKKVDSIALGISIIINIIILLSIPQFKIEKVLNRKLKVGLVALDSNKRRVTKKAFKDSEKKITKNTPAPKPKPAVEKTVKKEDVKKKQELSLDQLEKTITKANIDVLSKDTPSKKIVAKSLSGEISKKKKIEKSFSRESNLEKSLTPLVNLNDGISATSEEGFEIPDTKEVLNQSEDKIPVDFGKVYDVTSLNEGLPSGYKLGVEDGDIIAKWDSDNREPIYPESAQVRGMQGTVKLRLTIDPRGNVESLTLEKGSGVPEINFAIEKIARTWKIYLSKNGLNIKGDVILEYNFKLVGKN